MGFQPWVPQQDSNWEIRVVVLLSLLLQAHLIFVGPMRKRSSSFMLRFVVWACYLLADWVADLALGLLLNNMGVIGSDSSSNSPIIFAFWTPFLLLHLGGPDTITSYSLEDNELWPRHLIGLLFELFSAVVVIICSIRSNPLIPATVLILAAGVIKYGERTCSLYCGSIKSFRTNILGPPDPGPNYAKLMTAFGGKEKAGLVVEIAVTNGEAEQAQRAAEEKETTHLVLTTKSVEARAYEFFLIFRRLFVDLGLSSQERRRVQAFFLQRMDLRIIEAFEIIQLELNFVYDMMYTKAPVAYTRAGWVLRFICSGCILSALIIFFHHDKAGMKHVDVGITYALLLGALALDMAALAMLLFSDRTAVFLQRSLWFKWLERLIKKAWPWRPRRPWQPRRPRRWSETTSQLNLISNSLSKPEHYIGRWWLTISKILRAQVILDDLIFIKQVHLRKHEITEGADKGENHLLKFIFDGLRKAANEPEMKKKEEILKFCDCRGGRVLERLKDDIRTALENDKEKLAVIVDSVKERDFDESLLMWHIATNLCLLPDTQPVTPEKGTRWMRRVAETLSEYMLYLLVKQPEMVSAKSSAWLMRYRDTCAEARRFFGSIAAAPWMAVARGHKRGWLTRLLRWWAERKEDDKATVHVPERRMLLSVNTSQRPATVKGSRSKSVLFDACILAKALMELDDGDLRWEVLIGVWVEMLTYTASRCRGSTHMRQLNRGGELLTLLWFLMEIMGFGDTYEVQEGGECKVKLIVHDQ